MAATLAGRSRRLGNSALFEIPLRPACCPTSQPTLIGRILSCAYAVTRRAEPIHVLSSSWRHVAVAHVRRTHSGARRRVAVATCAIGLDKHRPAELLPLNVALDDLRIVHATAEIARVDKGAIAFRLTQPKDVIMLETEREIAPSEDYSIARSGKTAVITPGKHAAVDDRLTVRWRVLST